MTRQDFHEWTRKEKKLQIEEQTVISFEFGKVKSQTLG